MPRASWKLGGISPGQTPASGDASAWAMVPGVAAAAVVLGILCPWLRRGSLPQIGLIVLAASLLFLAVMVSGFVSRAIYAKISRARISPDGTRIFAPVVRAACLTSLWVPAWILFMQTWSLLMVVAACLCLASLGVFLKRCAVENAPAPEDRIEPGLHEAPFQFESISIGRVLLPSLVLALMMEGAIVLMGVRRYSAASLVCGVCVAALGWRAVSRLSPGTWRRPLLSNGSQGLIVSLAFVLTAVALLPYLKGSPFRGGLIPGLRGRGVARSVAARPKEQFANSSDGYSGIILLSPNEQQKRIVVPVKHDPTNFAVKLAQPIEIPFNGAYWYFKAPDKAPRITARVVHGNTLKATIRSSDFYPLLMEAHQKLADPIDLGCCSAIHLVVQNADRREGAIALELWVKKRAVTPPANHYLGTMTIPSSEHSPGISSDAEDAPAPPEEKLVFPVPAAMEGVQFDEITVVVRSAPARARTGAQIAIRRFVLQP